MVTVFNVYYNSAKQKLKLNVTLLEGINDMAAADEVDDEPPIHVIYCIALLL